MTEGRSHIMNKLNVFLISYPKKITHNKLLMDLWSYYEYKNITTTTVVSGTAYRSYKHAVNTNS